MKGEGEGERGRVETKEGGGGQTDIIICICLPQTSPVRLEGLRRCCFVHFWGRFLAAPQSAPVTLAPGRSFFLAKTRRAL